MPFHLTEPHPSTSRPCIPTGRGGAGNYTTVPRNVTAGPTATGPASLAPHLSSSSSRRVVTSGRGGAGNIAPSSERAIFSFDEELAHAQRLADRAAPVYHCGRGGAGNVASEGVGAYASGYGYGKRQGSASSELSFRSEGSERSGSGRSAKRSLEGAWSKVSKTFGRQ
ncbi:hypothetical protein EV356DRAFT_517598 [Viridothelium virens]|uniref:Uncharacterized protein n=1 Tax=Viridothelium virens TaxID=1048519 RepID=A0A6A6H333_VIRVR|nr:hypothetical protein EV356DRAFT_517598 [Viridothelium virens]